MSEVKGTLLAIVLAVSVFSILFTVITYSMKTSADTVAERMEQQADLRPDNSLLATPNN